MQVPLLDLKRYSDEVEGELCEAFGRVLRSGQYILGPEVEALEKGCAEYIGVKHAIGVSSGTDALLLALMAIGIEAGDEVICPSYTFFATAGSIWRMGAKPVFVDNDPYSFNIDPADVARKISRKTKAIIPVHLFGQCAEMDEIMDIAQTKRVSVIEDAAQAMGAEYKGKRAGTFGEFGCFSFFPSKNLGALGDAGLVTTNDDRLAEKARILRAHGAKPKYHHQMVGANFRIDALQAALIRVKLKYLDQYTARRQANSALYTRLLIESGLAIANADDSNCAEGNGTSANKTDGSILLPIVCQSRHIYNQYIIRVKNRNVRDRLRDFLKSNHVGTEVYYPVPMHLQECFKPLGYREGDFPAAESAAQETLALPIFPELTGREIQYVVDQMIAFFR